MDPREFLVDIQKSGDSQESLQLAVRYFACNDEEGWCVAVSQEYAISLEPDPDGGRHASFADSFFFNPKCLQ
jgi:hypothetical protein